MSEISGSGAEKPEMKEPPALAHIEKTLADSYRKEIDQEENVWRSLPFFAATLALQLGALLQLIERVPRGGSLKANISHVLLGVSIGCSLSALGFLTWCIFPATFRYVARDKALLEYALGLIKDEGHPDNIAQETPMVALHKLKESLAKQYALATDNNRRINKRRERRRSIAGLFTIASVVFTLLLVAATFITYDRSYDRQGETDGFPPRSTNKPRSATSAPSADPTPPTPADAAGH